VFRDIPGVVYKCEDCCEKKNTEYTSFVDAIKRLEALIKSLQDEIIQLKQEKNSDEAEKIIGEITDRQQRERNLIMFKVPEQQTGNLANRRAADLRTITEIINNIAPDIPTNYINAYRAGCIKRCQVVVKVNIMSSDLIGGCLTFYLNQPIKIKWADFRLDALLADTMLTKLYTTGP
jgi:Cys-tRNA synthase (O-phospho-L-seryl-tRNA:Cys-tRNA synthase)